MEFKTVVVSEASMTAKRSEMESQGYTLINVLPKSVGMYEMVFKPRVAKQPLLG